MKQIFLIYLVMIFCLAVPAQNKATDRQIEGLKGEVKTVSEDYMLTNVSSGPSEINKRVKSSEYLFDKDGRLIQILYPSSNRKLVFSVIEGNKTFKSSPISVEEETKRLKLGRVDFDDVPIEKPEKLVPPDERFDQKYIYKYDAQGRVKTERQYGNNGKLFKLAAYKYDEKGRVLEENVNDTGALSKFTYKYDKAGNLSQRLEIRDIKGSGKDSTSRIIYSEYQTDAQGNWTQRKSFYTTKTKDSTYSVTTVEYRTIAYF